MTQWAGSGASFKGPSHGKNKTPPPPTLPQEMSNFSFTFLVFTERPFCLSTALNL